MKGIPLIIVIFLLFSCNAHIANDKTFLNSKNIYISDFKFQKNAPFNCFDYEAKGFKKLLDTNLINDWFNQGDYQVYYFYFYSIHRPIGQLLPITFIQTGDDYGAIVLKLINCKTGKVQNTYELFGGPCGGPGEIKNGIFQLCEKNTSIFLNDSTILNTKVHFYCNSLSEENDMQVDTIKYLLSIDRIKGLFCKKVDSVRINSKVKYYAR